MGTQRSKPLICLQMVMEICSDACDKDYLGQLRLHALVEDLRWQMKAFNGIDKIDKMLFPFPYAQLVKIFNLVFCFTLPFGIYSKLKITRRLSLVWSLWHFTGLTRLESFL